MMNNQLTAPTKIPHDIKMVAEKEAPPSSFGVAGMEGMGGSAGGVMGSMFGSGNAPKVQAAPPKKVNISAGVAVGMLLQKTSPLIRPSPRPRASPGTVVLQATISKTGTIENLRVISGPAMLQQAALDAVKAVALQALPAQQRAGRSGNHGQRDLHPGWMMNFPAPFRFWEGLAFDLNANPERAAFLSNRRRGGSQFTRNSLGGTIQ
jgi:TonB family protein